MPSGIYVRTQEHKLNLALALRGKKRNEEQRKRMREAHKDIPSGRKGRHFLNEQGLHLPHCIDCGIEISYRHIRCRPCYIRYNWRGKDAHVETLHQWIRKRKPKPELCECCDIKPPYDCANISGKYLRDVNDYEWLCRRCHMLKDGRLKAARLRAPYTIKAMAV